MQSESPEIADAAAALAGSDIESLYRREFTRFLSVAAAITGDLQSGHDAVQEGFANALSRRATLRRPDALEPWLWRAVVNAARDERRSARRRRAHTEERTEIDDLAAVTPPTRGEGVRRAIAALPERQRLVLFLRYYADLDYAAIAEALSVRRGTIGPTLSHAHAALRRLMEVDP